MFNEVSGLGLDESGFGTPCPDGSIPDANNQCPSSGGYVCPDNTYNAGSVVSDPSQCGGTIGGSGSGTCSGWRCPDGSCVSDSTYCPGGWSGMCPDGTPAASASQCPGASGSTRPPVGGAPASTGTSFWDALANLFKTGPAIASAATGNPLPGQLPAGYRASPYPGYVYGPTGALVPSSGISGGISLSPGGVGGSLNISPTLLIFGAVFLVIAISGKR